MTLKEQKLARLIGKAVATKRLKKKLTQGQLAERLGVEPETISRIERGITLAPVSRLSGIADVLGVPLADLIRDGSPRLADRAQSLAASLQGIPDADLVLVLEVVEKLTARFRRK